MILATHTGAADATAPYWTVDAFYQERARQHKFRHTCTTLGYDSTFIVRTDVPTNDAAGSSPNRSVVAAIASCAAFLAVGFVAFVLFVRKRELQNNPLFTALTQQSEGKRQSTYKSTQMVQCSSVVA